MKYMYVFSLLGPVPEGADAVVQVEDTEQIEHKPDEVRKVHIQHKVSEGHDIRPVV